jgi:small-conductance mechanosensitive channel
MATTPVTTGVDTSGEVVGAGSPLDLANLVPTILGKFIAVLEAALIIIIGIFVIRFIRGKLHKIETEHEQQRNAINLFEKITSGFIIVIVITIALKTVGIDMTLLVSVAILGLSYGLQDIIKNYVAGILILFKAPFKIGDVVKIRDFTGKVVRMDFQSTNLQTFDNRNITIYNSDVMTQSIINYSNNTMRRLDFDVMVGYGSDVPTALQVFDKILLANQNVLKNPKYSIVFKKFSETGPIFTLKFWIQRPCNILKIRTEIAAQISQSFDEVKILSPYAKDVQTESEPDLSKITDDRKNRIQTFYQLPLFAMAAAPVEPPLAEDAIPGTIPMDVTDSDEPEAL